MTESLSRPNYEAMYEAKHAECEDLKLRCSELENEVRELKTSLKIAEGKLDIVRLIFGRKE